MGATVIGFVLGAVVGAMWGTEAGAMAGGLLGALSGFSVHGAAWLWAHSGDEPTVERHRLLCTPVGQFADVELLGDMQRKRWLDVQRCSLEGDTVTCDKTCLRLMNDGRVRPGRSCDCPAHTIQAAEPPPPTQLAI
jgi:hypothetical protein